MQEEEITNHLGLAVSRLIIRYYWSRFFFCRFFFGGGERRRKNCQYYLVKNQYHASQLYVLIYTIGDNLIYLFLISQAQVSVRTLKSCTTLVPLSPTIVVMVDTSNQISWTVSAPNRQPQNHRTTVFCLLLQLEPRRRCYPRISISPSPYPLLQYIPHKPRGTYRIPPSKIFLLGRCVIHNRQNPSIHFRLESSLT